MRCCQVHLLERHARKPARHWWLHASLAWRVPGPERSSSSQRPNRYCPKCTWRKANTPGRKSNRTVVTRHIKKASSRRSYKIAPENREDHTTAGMNMGLFEEAQPFHNNLSKRNSIVAWQQQQQQQLQQYHWIQGTAWQKKIRKASSASRAKMTRLTVL